MSVACIPMLPAGTMERAQLIPMGPAPQAQSGSGNLSFFPGMRCGAVEGHWIQGRASQSSAPGWVEVKFWRGLCAGACLV